MNFEQYKDQVLKRTEQVTNVPVLASDTKNLSIEQQVKLFDKTKMVGRTINKIKYCIYNGKFIDLDELAVQVRALYAAKGYINRGYSKLDAEDYTKYTATKQILKKLFNNSTFYDEIDPKAAAIYFLTADFLIS